MIALGSHSSVPYSMEAGGPSLPLLLGARDSASRAGDRVLSVHKFPKMRRALVTRRGVIWAGGEFSMPFDHPELATGALTDRISIYIDLGTFMVNHPAVAVQDLTGLGGRAQGAPAFLCLDEMARRARRQSLEQSPPEQLDEEPAGHRQGTRRKVTQRRASPWARAAAASTGGRGRPDQPWPGARRRPRAP